MTATTTCTHCGTPLSADGTCPICDARIGDGIELDDPTETHERDDGEVDVTEPERDDEISAGVVFIAASLDANHKDALSVMERDVLDSVDGVRSLGEIADILAIHVRGARKIAASLLERGLIRARS